MTSSAPTYGAQTQLPNKVIRGIVENLHHFRDRGTLLHLALVNKAWCAESQPVLFRTVCDDSWDPKQCQRLIQTHTLFLEAIILNPARLGSYVRTYKQRGLICPPSLATKPGIQFAGAMPHLWDLTAKALPALVNLKHLFIVPGHDDTVDGISPASLLEGCTFTLGSLTWGFWLLHRRPMAAFLRTQHTLVHLAIGYATPSREVINCLPDDACPSLRSLSCTMGVNTASQVVRNWKTIVGLSLPMQNMWYDDLSALQNIQYLSVRWDQHLIPDLAAVDCNVVLLEITSPAWPRNNEVAKPLPGFSKLRVLAFVQDEARYTVPVLNSMKAVKAEILIESFRRCPQLEYVIQEDEYRHDGPRQYRKLTLHGAPESAQELRSEEFHLEYKVEDPWWSAYGV